MFGFQLYENMVSLTSNHFK